MGKLSDLLSAVDQLKALDEAYYRLFKEKITLQIELDRLEELLTEQRDTISRTKEEIWDTVCRLRLNRREDAPVTNDEFCDAVIGWVERANTIRKASNVVYLDGKDLDIPDVDIPEEEPFARPCYPCKIHKEVLEVLDVLGNIRPELREVLRIRYCIREDELYASATGHYPTSQWYIAKQMGVSRSTVSRLLKKATRAIRHPYRSERLVPLIYEKEDSDIHCPAEYMVVDIFKLWQ